MNNPVLQAIFDRRSIRAYEPKQITGEQMRALMETAVASPSARNSQPWHFTFAQDARLLDEISDAVREQMLKTRVGEERKRFEKEDFHVFYHAPTVVFISADVKNSSSYMDIDCGIAAQSLAIAAEGMNLGSVILGMPREAFASEKGGQFREKLGFPKDYDLRIAVAVGYKACEKDAHRVEEGKITVVP